MRRTNQSARSFEAPARFQSYEAVFDDVGCGPIAVLCGDFVESVSSEGWLGAVHGKGSTRFEADFDLAACWERFFRGRRSIATLLRGRIGGISRSPPRA